METIDARHSSQAPASNTNVTIDWQGGGVGTIVFNQSSDGPKHVVDQDSSSVAASFGGAPDPNEDENDHMFGAKGTKTKGSVKLWNKGKARIDLENIDPGKRLGNMHYQDKSISLKDKFYYNPKTGQFDGLSKAMNKKLLKDKQVQRAIKNGLKILGE